MKSNYGMLHHIEIYVSNLKRSLKFWDWFLAKLGYVVYQSWDKGKSWKLGDTYIVFVQTEDKYLDISYHRKRVGLNHLAFYGGSKKMIEKIKRELVEKGITMLYQNKDLSQNDYYAIYFEDPDRIKVELIAKDKK